MPRFFTLVVLSVLWPLCGLLAQPLQVSKNGRYLIKENGEPFFWLGDTAWELFHRLNREEATRYLQNRADKGFSVIQAVILAERDGLTAPNAYGHLPLANKNPEKPVEAYFAHVDFVIQKASELGLYVAVLPSWGKYWNNWNNNGIFTPENARNFGRFLGSRYRNADNLVWVLGGDANIENEEQRSIITAMAEGLGQGNGQRHLVTYHPSGPGRSSDYFHQAQWLDFNMYQSSHAAHDFDNGLFAAHDRQLSPPKPTLDAEPRYEQIISGFYYQGNSNWDRFDDFDARTAAYWSLLAGACGHTYGNNNIWQMYDEGRESVIGAQIPWYEAIDHPGAFSMKHLARLFRARPYYLLQPAQQLLLDAPGSGPEKVRVAVASDQSFAFIYSPRGAGFTLDLSPFNGKSMRALWYNPRYGETYLLQPNGQVAIKTFTPPTKGRGNDWVLILDDNTKNFSLPGRSKE